MPDSSVTNQIEAVVYAYGEFEAIAMHLNYLLEMDKAANVEPKALTTWRSAKKELEEARTAYNKTLVVLMDAVARLVRDYVSVEMDGN